MSPSIKARASSGLRPLLPLVMCLSFALAACDKGRAPAGPPRTTSGQVNTDQPPPTKTGGGLKQQPYDPNTGRFVPKKK